jgi:hypothetical protein
MAAWLLPSLAACAGPQASGPQARPAPEPAIQETFAAPARPPLAREDFNRLGARLDTPLYWATDGQNPGQLDPDELVLLGVGQDRALFVGPDGRFTPLLQRALAELGEARRLESVGRELDSSRPILVETDLRDRPPAERAMARHLVAAARLVEELYAEQRGAHALRACLRPGDRASAALFRRNQTPWCESPGEEQNPFCNACPDLPARRSGLYPPGLQARPGFCEELVRHPQAEALLSPFTVVREQDGQPVAVPYHQAFAPRVRAVALELGAAADALGQAEPALVRYLRAAARAFETDDWFAADEAWTAMNGQNSRYYLRIGPDEVYRDPCNRKAGYHVSFALIDPDAVYWQERLSPLRADMENRLAALAGPPYRAREVSVQLPDFIEIVLNAGDSRSPSGATIGQSLPNWGPVADEGRGRTVVMSNLYTDPDSRAVRRAQAESLLAPEAMERYTEDKRLTLLDIILHEATHNFGPQPDTRLEGPSARDRLGGSTATVLEELKAQTGSLLYVELLRTRGLLTREEAERVYLHALVWCFGHISRGMVDAQGNPKPYSQLAAIQVAFLAEAGALEWQAGELAADGRERGRFAVRFERIPAAAEALMALTAQALASGDPVRARALIEPRVQGEAFGLVRQAEVAERLLRHPRGSFVYAVAP